MPSIFWSPSTQEHNAGVDNYIEEDYMNLLCDKIIPLAAYNGFTNYRNKRTDTLQQVIADSNSKVPDIHVALHSDAGVSNASGATSFGYMVAGRLTNSERLAKCVYGEIAVLTPWADRGVKDGNAAKLAEIRSVRCTSMLIELFFHTNSANVAFFKTHINEFAEAVVRGVCKYFDMTFKLSSVVQSALIRKDAPALSQACPIDKWFNENDKISITGEKGDYVIVKFGPNNAEHYIPKKYVEVQK